jgi:hypothetical protein
MTAQEVIALVIQHLTRTVRESVHILGVVPEKDKDWGVLLEYDGLVWKQIVHAGGEFGDLKLQPPVRTAA